jgi:hypothetical protein
VSSEEKGKGTFNFPPEMDAETAKEFFNRRYGKVEAVFAKEARNQAYGSQIGVSGSDGSGDVPGVLREDNASTIKEHIRASAVREDGGCVALCGAFAPSGQWKAGAAYQGLMILGGKPEDFCPECSRLWLKEQNVP